jgi:hypothetical protein
MNINSKYFTFSENTFVIEESELEHLVGRNYGNVFIESDVTKNVVEFTYSHTNRSPCGEIIAKVFKPLQKFVMSNAKLKNVELVIFNT